MAHNDVLAADPRRARSFNELLALDGECLAAHDPRHGQPLDRADGCKDQHNVALKHRQQQDHEEDEGQSVEYVDNAHHEIVDATTEITCRRTPTDADHEADSRGDNADHERDTQADHQARKQVSSLQVGSERMQAFQRRRNGAQVRNGAVLVDPDKWPDDCKQNEEAENPHGDDGGAVAEQARPGIFPERASPNNGILNRFDATSRVEERIKIRHQSYFTFGSSRA